MATRAVWSWLTPGSMPSSFKTQRSSVAYGSVSLSLIAGTILLRSSSTLDGVRHGDCSRHLHPGDVSLRHEYDRVAGPNSALITVVLLEAHDCTSPIYFPYFSKWEKRQPSEDLLGYDTAIRLSHAALKGWSGYRRRDSEVEPPEHTKHSFTKASHHRFRINGVPAALFPD